MRIGIKQTGGLPYMGISAVVDATVAQVQDEADRRFPAGHGVAWVHGYDTAPESNLGGGMTLHMGRCPVVRRGAKFMLLKTSYRQLSNSK